MEGLFIDEGLEAGETIRIVFPDMVNPFTLAESNSLVVSTLNVNEEAIDSADEGFTVTPTKPGDIQINSISGFSQNNVLQETEIGFFIKPAFRYQPGGYIKVTFPTDVSLDSSTLECDKLIGFSGEVSCEAFG